MARVSSALFAILLLLPSVAQSQFVGETAFTKDGVRWMIRPSAVISTSPEGVVRIELTDINARIDRAHGIEVDGARYDHNSFGGAIAGDLDALEVTSLSVGFTFDGVQGCGGRLGLAAWQVGGTMTLSCNSGSAARFTGYSINGLSSSGVLDLHRKVRRLRNDAARAAQQQTQQTQSSPAAAGAAGSAAGAASARPGTSGPGSTGSGTGSTATSSGSASATAGTTQADRDAAARAAYTDSVRRADQAAESARLEREANDAARMDAINQTATGLANVATSIAGAIAENRRMDEQRRENLAAARERYRAAVAANFRRMPAQPQCARVRGVEIAVGQDYQGQLTGRECRVNSQASAVQYTLEVRERTKVAFAMRTAFWPRISIYNLTNGDVVATSQEYVDRWLEPGTYNVIAHSELAGETGAYTLTVQPGRRSWAGGWQFGMGADIATATADNLAETLSEPVLGFRIGTPFKQGPAIEERFTLTLDGSIGEAVTTIDLGARLYVLGKTTAWRPYVQASYGYVSLCNQACVDSDIFATDFYSSSGTALTFAAGLHWYFNPVAAVDLGYFSTSGDLEEGPMSLNRIRIGIALHASPPLAPR